MSTFIDLHILQTLPPSNINRDDTGSPKSAIYGGVRRARVSSQAWKRATRAEFNDHLDDRELGERTAVLAHRIAERIEGLNPELAANSLDLAAGILQAAGIKVKVSSKDDQKTAETGYLVFASRQQIDALAKLAVDNAEDIKKAPKKEAKAAMQNDHSIDVALFGRMIADAPDLNVDATCQVAHALSVHTAASEFDYFTAVDDNKGEDSSGAAMIGTVEFVAPTLYRYATIDAEALTKSLGSKEAAARASEAFIRAFVRSMPTGKQNTFGNRTLPYLVVLQVHSDQPRNLVEAFETPVDVKTNRTTEAAKRLADYAHELDEAYGNDTVAGTFVAAGGAAKPEALEKLAVFGERTDLDELVKSVGSTVEKRVDG